MFTAKFNMWYRRKLIQTASDYLCTLEEYVHVEYCEDGHDGAGWYAWDEEYPEDGSVRLTFWDVCQNIWLRTKERVRAWWSLL